MANRKYFHILSQAEQHLLFLPETGRLFTLGKDQASSIREYEKGEPVSKEVLGKKFVQLMSEEKERQEVIGRKRSVVSDSSNDTIQAVCLFVAHDCNMQCAYCFNKGGKVCNKGKMMTYTVIEQIFSRIVTTVKKKSHFSFAFIGGEPLLNFEVIKQTAELADRISAEKGIQFIYGLATNGTVLTDNILNFFRKYKPYLTLSLDGPQKYNDLQRVRSDGSSVYAKFLENYETIRREAACYVGINAVITKNNCHALYEVIEHLRHLKPDGFGVEPVHLNNSHHLAIGEKDFYLLKTQFVEVIRNTLKTLTESEKPENFEFAFGFLYSLLRRARAYHHCIFGHKAVAIDAEGWIYPSYRLVGNTHFRMGNIFENPFNDSHFKSIRQKFLNNTSDIRDECCGCWGRYICGGFCYDHSFFRTEEVFKPDKRHCAMVLESLEEIILYTFNQIHNPPIREKLYKEISRWIDQRKR